MSNRSLPKHALDNRANQLNPSHPSYHRSRGAPPGEAQRLASEPKGDPAQPVTPADPPTNPAGGQQSGGKQA